MGYLKQLSVLLQVRQEDIASGLQHFKLVQLQLETIRSTNTINTKHREMFEATCQMAEEVNVTPRKPRTCSRQNHRANALFADDDVKAYYRANLTIPFLDYLLTEFEYRFDILKSQALTAFTLLPSLAAQTLPNTDSFQYFMDDLPSQASLRQELDLWHLFWSAVSSEERPSTALESLKSCNRKQFPNIFLILQTIVVMPVTSFEAERSFSGLRQIKGYSRATMGEERLNGLALMMMHRDIEISIASIIDESASKKPRRMRLQSILDDPLDESV